MNFAIPSGRNAEISVYDTVTLEPGSAANVVNKGTKADAHLLFEIPRGEKGDKGDEHIYVGTVAPEDTSLIWYDPSDYTFDNMSAPDALYKAYLQTSGKRVEVDGEFTNVYLSKDEFLDAIGNLSPINGFEVRVKPDFESLGVPTKDKLGYIYLIPSSKDSSDMYEEWIVVDTAETVVGEDSYKWEK